MDAVVDDLVTKEDAPRQTTLADYNDILLDAARATKMHLPSTTTTTVAPTTPTVNLVRVNFICNERMLEKQHHIPRQCQRNITAPIAETIHPTTAETIPARHETSRTPLATVQARPHRYSKAKRAGTNTIQVKSQLWRPNARCQPVEILSWGSPPTVGLSQGNWRRKIPKSESIGARKFDSCLFECLSLTCVCVCVM